MPKIKFTKSAIDKLEFEGKQVDYFDTDTAGFGLRIGRATKTFFCKADVKDAGTRTGYRTVRKTLGRYGEITLAQARKEMNGHDDPEKGFVPGRRLELKRGETTVKGAGVTLMDMLHQFLSEKRTRNGKERKASTIRGYQDRVKQHFGSWHNMTLPEISKYLTPDVLIETHKEIAENNGPYAARNAFVVLSAVLNYARLKYPAALPVNPLSIIMSKDAGILAPIQKRTEYLDKEDFRQFYEGIQKFNAPTRDCYLLALYQGMRSSEAAALRWDHVDMEKKEIRIPDTKNREDLHVPLARQSLEIMRRRRQEVPDDNPWVFASCHRLNKSGHVRLTASRLRDKTGLSMTVHGLRRSFITEGRKLKLAQDTDRLVNHIDSSVSGRHYDETEIEDFRSSLQTIADKMDSLMKGESAKVISLPIAQRQA